MNAAESTRMDAAVTRLAGQLTDFAETLVGLSRTVVSLRAHQSIIEEQLFGEALPVLSDHATTSGELTSSSEPPTLSVVRGGALRSRRSQACLSVVAGGRS